MFKLCYVYSEREREREREVANVDVLNMDNCFRHIALTLYLQLQPPNILNIHSFVYYKRHLLNALHQSIPIYSYIQL